MGAGRSGAVPTAFRILIVDDHEVLRRGVESIVNRFSLGQVCGEADNGEDAVRKVKELKPDLVIMDVSMPSMNGLEATRHIREIAPETKVLILTMHNSSQILALAKQRGVDRVVEKSSIGPQLVEAIRQLSVP